MQVISFYLPQYHPIPENDQWWGKGFTEWRNVVKARPRFRGHYQPHLPADLGFYDLRVAATRIQQAELARQHGINAFCYYHYWFNGRILLERPLLDLLESGQPDFPFCICWANETWSKRWDGSADQVLLEQTYSPRDDQEHIQWLLPFFKDRRYLRIKNRPLLLIYRSFDLPEPQQTMALWQAAARKAGLDGLYIVAVDNNSTQQSRTLPLNQGFDAVVEFQPAPKYYRQAKSSPINNWLRQRLRGNNLLRQWYKNYLSADMVLDYQDFVDCMIDYNRRNASAKVWPCCCPSWDNSPRIKRGALIFRNSNPASYGRWLRDCLVRAERLPQEEQVVFINAWNEWAEGNHLEPDERFGLAFLAETLKQIQLQQKGW